MSVGILLYCYYKADTQDESVIVAVTTVVSVTKHQRVFATNNWHSCVFWWVLNTWLGNEIVQTSSDKTTLFFPSRIVIVGLVGVLLAVIASGFFFAAFVVLLGRSLGGQRYGPIHFRRGRWFLVQIHIFTRLHTHTHTRTRY